MEKKEGLIQDNSAWYLSDSYSNVDMHYELGEEILYVDTFVSPGSANEDLALKAKLLSAFAWRMASAGAETRLIHQSVKKMAHDLNCHQIDLNITRDGILLKLKRGRVVSVEFKEIRRFAINMDSLERLHQICLDVSNGKLSDLNKIYLAIRAVRPRHYSHNLLILIESLACAAFAYLNGGNLPIGISAFIGGLVLMHARFSFIKKGFFESFTFMLSAFLGSLCAASLCHYVFDLTRHEAVLSATATTLLLVPGFPIINGFLDIFKGYVPIGISRLVISTVLITSAAIGLLMTHYILSFITTVIP